MTLIGNLVFYSRGVQIVKMDKATDQCRVTVTYMGCMFEGLGCDGDGSRKGLGLTKGRHR